MKKIFLTTITLLSMASASVFGMYGVDTDWIFFLTHGNQFRARLDQLGFTLGNDTIKGTFGFDNNTGYGGAYGGLLVDNDPTGKHSSSWVPSISMGLGYTSSLISVGVGYNATIGGQTQKYNGKTEPKTVNKSAHTPVLVLNAMDNAFRMAIPIQVYVNNDKYSDAAGGGYNNEMAVSVDSQFRYYTGLDALPQVRLYLRYGLYQNESKATKDAEKVKTKYGESFGFDFRLYFGSMVEEVALQPLVKLAYNQALGNYHQDTKVEAVKAMNGDYNSYQSGSYGGSVWDLQLMTGLGLTANSDIVSLYLEPQLGLAVTSRAPIVGTAPGTPAPARVTTESYSLAYNVYAEIYITPLKNLEWYFEAQLGSGANQNSLVFNGTTGITWYLPAL
ncbi:cell surface protein [uncultured Brachyspira sp.]|uniref:cell surface protein n=1 Tax=uncultured Brachyspira sp. TaxID=221953 RepID=UPI00259B29F8|nr:cell surface protein [uncultured Brachyspira sp.]